MRIKAQVGASVLASAACLLAACSGMDPSDPAAAIEDELGAFQSMAPTPAADLSQGASCVESLRPAGLECPGMSPIEMRAIQATLAPRLMSIAPSLRVTILRTGNSTLARIDGADGSRAFESLFGTDSFLVPVEADGSFEVTAPIAERGGMTRGGFGLGGVPGIGLGGLGLGAVGQPGFAGRFGPTPGGPIGGGPAIQSTAGQPGAAGEACCPGGQSSGFAQPGLAGQYGAPGIGMRGLSGPAGFAGGAGACPSACGVGIAMPQMPTGHAYGVLAHLEGKVDLAGLQFATDEVNKTQVAILDRDQNLNMKGEIVLIPLTGAEAEGPQAVPGGPQAAPAGPPAAAFGGGPQAQGAVPGGSQAGFGPQAQGAIPGGPQAGLRPQAGPVGPQAGFGPQAGPGAEAGVACRIPLQICGSCGVAAGLATEGAVITTPAVPQMTCPQMIVRPTMAAPCCPGVGVSPMSFGAPSCPSGCQ